MSTVYNLEPQPTAKAILHTTSGDISLELFAHQTPKTCRNFLQHCLDGYYENTIFHRLVPNFIIQGGDPTGTGFGGQSSYEGGRTFEDEIHSRLKFNRRGLLGMANTGDKNDNGSQFFLTLGVTAELQGRNTMFGRVEGDTIYNLVKMGEAELVEGEGSERPMFPTKITSTEILVNPFEDMIKRVREAKRVVEEKGTKKKVKKKATKGLLSFGEDEEEGYMPIVTKAKFNPKAVDAGNEDDFAKPAKRPAPENPHTSAKRRKTSSSPSASPPPRPREQVRPTAVADKSKEASRSASPSTSPEPEVSKPANALDRANAQIAEIKSSMKRNVKTLPQEAVRKKSALEAMIPATATRGRKRKAGGGAGLGNSVSAEEQKTLDAFNAFKKKLEATPAAEKETIAQSNGHSNGADGSPGQEPNGANDNDYSAKATGDAGEDEANLCDLHFIANCQSCKRWDKDIAEGSDDNLEGDDGAWLSHRLTFEKDRLGKDLEWKRQNAEILEEQVIDPKKKAREIKEEQKKHKAKSR